MSGLRHQTFHHLLLFLLQLFDQPLALVRELVALEEFLRVALESLYQLLHVALEGFAGTTAEL